jgi:hypothetical protein
MVLSLRDAASEPGPSPRIATSLIRAFTAGIACCRTSRLQQAMCDAVALERYSSPNVPGLLCIPATRPKGLDALGLHAMEM